MHYNHLTSKITFTCVCTHIVLTSLYYIIFSSMFLRWLYVSPFRHIFFQYLLKSCHQHCASHRNACVYLLNGLFNQDRQCKSNRIECIFHKRQSKKGHLAESERKIKTDFVFLFSSVATKSIVVCVFSSSTFLGYISKFGTEYMIHF